MDMNRRFL